MIRSKTRSPDAPPRRPGHVVEPGGRPDRVTIVTGQVLNLGNYSSARVETGFETDVRPGESSYDAQVRAFKVSEAFLGEALEAIQQAAVLPPEDIGRTVGTGPSGKKKTRNRRRA
jgi:hypothetical protein